jgi:hypothetical protein
MKLTTRKPLLISILSVLSACTQSDNTSKHFPPTYDVVLYGTDCTLSKKTQNIDCTYKIGSDLELIIAGVGSLDAGITILRTPGYDGDYYATVGAGGNHTCVIVKPGMRPKRLNIMSALDYAFISPQTGRVYHIWEECPSFRHGN